MNYGGSQGQCYVTSGMPGPGTSFDLRDLLSDVVYQREGTGSPATAFILDLPAWGHHVFELRARSA